MTLPSSIQRIKELLKDIRAYGSSKSDGICWDIATWKFFADTVESLLDERERHVEALEMIVKVEPDYETVQRPYYISMIKCQDIAKQALSDESGKEDKNG